MKGDASICVGRCERSCRAMRTDVKDDASSRKDVSKCDGRLPGAMDLGEAPPLMPPTRGRYRGDDTSLSYVQTEFQESAGGVVKPRRQDVSAGRALC